MSFEHWNSERKSIWGGTNTMPTVNEITTSSTNGPLVYRPYSPDNRQMQPHKQPWRPSEYQPSNAGNTKESICGPNKKWFITVCGIAVLLGVVISAIPLGVMTTLYVQQKSSSSSATSSGSSGSSSGSSATLPSQCSSYTTRSEADRNAGYSSCGGCYCDSSVTAGWYRITGAAGTRLATSPVSNYYCGTTYPGWFNGTLPSTGGTTTTGTVCINVNGNLCYSPYSVNTVLVTNCNDFYVFYLVPMMYCSTRYCTV